MSLLALLGDRLLTRDENTTLSAAMSGGATRVGLYFSASWCGPCKSFTPKLSAWWTEHGAGAASAVLVFVPLDRTERQFDDYRSTMRWDLALPFQDPHIEALMEAYRVDGIPSLVWLDAATLAVLTREGVEELSHSPSSPWPFTSGVAEVMTAGPPTDDALPGVWALLDTAGCVSGPGGVQRRLQDVRKSTTSIGLYFSAHWCPPCRAFTPVLSEWYRGRGGGGASPFELIFVTHDRDPAQYTQYRATMPWLALPFEGTSSVRERLASTYGVSGIPCLMTFDSASGEVLCKDGRSALSDDPQGWPWAGRAAAEGGGGCSVQ